MRNFKNRKIVYSYSRNLPRAITMILIILSALFLTSCGRPAEVQRRIVVHALGIDPLEDGYEVSYQVFSGKAPDGAPVDADESTVVTLLAQGRTLYETEESLRLQTGKEVFLGDAELIVINSELADAPMEEFLGYFKDSDIYLGVNVIYCKGSAAETIGSKLRQGSATAILLRSVVEEAVRNSRAMNSRIIELYNALEQDNEAVAVPVLSLELGDDKGDGYTLTDTTLGVFNSQILTPSGPKEMIDEDAVMGISLLRGDAKEMTLQVKAGEGIASVELDGIKIRRKLEIRDGVPQINVYITGKYDVKSRPEGADDDEIRAAAERQLLDLCEAGSAYSGSGDLFRVQKMLLKYAPAYSEELGDDIKEIVSKTVFSVYAVLRKY